MTHTPGAPKGNQNALHPSGKPISGVGRIVCDLGEQKVRIIRACNVLKPKRKLIEWVREAVEEKLRKEGF